MGNALGFPRRFGSRHVLCKELGRGGMGSVFLAAAGGRLCAVKVLGTAEAGAAADRARRFENEARLAMRLDHPNLAYVIESGRAEGGPFIAMEYVRGKTLLELWTRMAHLGRAPTMGLSLYIGREVSRALAYLHERPGGLVHRDVTPPNVMLGYTGAVKLLDLGLTKATEVDAATTVGIWGAAGYVSPERRRGESFDRRADIYALGVILWELLARRPFPGETEAGTTLRPPEPPSRFVSDVPSDLDGIVMKAVAPRPEERTASAHELGDALGRLIGGEQDARKLESTLREIFAGEIAAERKQEDAFLAQAASLCTTGGDGTPARVPQVIAAVVGGAALAVAAAALVMRRIEPHPAPPTLAYQAPREAPPAAAAAAPPSPAATPQPTVRPAPAHGVKASPSKQPSADELLAQAEESFARGRVNEALYSARAAVKAGGGLTAQLILGKIYLAASRYEEAIATYDAALATDPGNQDAELGRRLAVERRRTGR